MPAEPANPSPLSERELVLVRETDFPAARLYAAWTTPELLVQWFTPHPWSTKSCELDLRVGGACRTVMVSPEGEEFPNTGVYLELIPNEKIVFTDAYLPGWEPNPGLFFTAVLTFETLPAGGSRYTARVRHWTQAACEKHATMGFEEGWGKACDQLLEMLRRTPVA